MQAGRRPAVWSESQADRQACRREGGRQCGVSGRRIDGRTGGEEEQTAAVHTHTTGLRTGWQTHVLQAFQGRIYEEWRSTVDDLRKHRHTYHWRLDEHVL